MPSDDGPSARYSDGSGTRVQPLAKPGRLVPIAHTTRTEVQVVGRVDGPITAPAGHAISRPSRPRLRRYSGPTPVFGVGGTGKDRCPRQVGDVRSSLAEGPPQAPSEGCVPSQSANGAQCQRHPRWFGRPGRSMRPLAQSSICQGSPPAVCHGNKRVRARNASSGSGSSRKPSPLAASSP
jgi:hypothetical protein